MSSIIKLQNISKIYQTKNIETSALDDVSLEIEEGEFVSIMGPSGCGKSTMLNIMGLLDKPTSGTVEIKGKNVDGMSDKALARLRNETLGFVFQSFHLINTLNIVDNVMIPLVYRHGAKDKSRLAREALERVGLSHRLGHMPSQLSGGQAQRVAIARAIVGNPSIILADEPCGNLDSKMGAEIDGSAPSSQQRPRQDHSHGHTQRRPGAPDRPHHQLLRRTPRKMKQRFLCSLIALTIAVAGYASTREITLAEAVAMARRQSVDAAVALNELRSAYWEYRTFKADLLPEISFSATARATIPATAPTRKTTVAIHSCATTI